MSWLSTKTNILLVWLYWRLRSSQQYGYKLNIKSSWNILYSCHFCGYPFWLRGFYFCHSLDSLYFCCFVINCCNKDHKKHNFNVEKVIMPKRTQQQCSCFICVVLCYFSALLVTMTWQKYDCQNLLTSILAGPLA